MGPESRRCPFEPLSSENIVRMNSSSRHIFFFFFGFHQCLLQADHVTVYVDHDKDVVTGLKQKTHYGRPAWDKEFEIVRKENPT